MRPVRTLVVGLAVAALVATGCEWHFETLDGNGGGNGRITADTGEHGSAIIYNGRPHVFYRDHSGGNLRHGYWNGSFWAFETLDGAGGGNGRINANVGFYHAAILYNGRPHVFYYDVSDNDLRHGYWNGQFWAFETLDGSGGGNGRISADVGRHNSVVLYNGRPHVFSWNETDRDLRHAYFNGSFWAFETLDGAGGANGRVNSNVGEYNAVVLYNARPHVFYYDNATDDLRHAYYNGSAWGFETLDGHRNGPNGRINASLGVENTAILYNNRPHVFYNDGTNFDLRHAYYNGSVWGFETLDGQGGGNGRTTRRVGRYNAAILHNNRPRVFYHDTTNGDLRQGYWNGQFWAFEILDGAGGTQGQTTNVVGHYNAPVVYNGRPDVFYYDFTDDTLRHGWFG